MSIRSFTPAVSAVFRFTITVQSKETERFYSGIGTHPEASTIACETRYISCRAISLSRRPSVQV